MKKSLSILLLFIMLITGAHPVLALHFCGGELHSFGLTNPVEKSCCASAQGETRSGYSEKEQSITKSHSDCCNTQKIKIATDNYRNQVQQLDLSKLLTSSDHIGFAPAYPIGWTTPEALRLAESIFPPGTSVFQNSDILTYICIFRI
ncbi:HYC_CC_PP family protein [Viscerimonas tarda]